MYGRSAIEHSLGPALQVKKLAADVHQAVPGVTVLVNNAGIFGGRERQVSVDGFEMTWAVNVLAPFLLTGVSIGDN